MYILYVPDPVTSKLIEVWYFPAWVGNTNPYGWVPVWLVIDKMYLLEEERVEEVNMIKLMLSEPVVVFYVALYTVHPVY